MANQMLAKSGDEEPTLTIEQKVKNLFLDPKKFSDVCFLVGDQSEKIYANRVFLAAESEVFESMFYGKLKETKYEIVVPDLTPIGFRNMIKYFYTKKIEEIGLPEIHATYMAANKYLALELIKDLTGHISRSLNVSNSCIIYDQLLKLAIDDSLIDDVKERIATRSSEACTSDEFDEIGEDTLVTILQFDSLNISELELLEACTSWTDNEVARRRSLDADQTSKRKVFERIKPFIRFGDLSLAELSSISDLHEYLTIEEIGSIFLHLSDPSQPIQINYRSPREACKAYLIKSFENCRLSGSESVRELKTFISVDEAVHAFSIQTFAISNCSSLTFEVFVDEKPLPLYSEVVDVQAGPSKSFTIKSDFVLEPQVKYKLEFSFSMHHDNVNSCPRFHSVGVTSAKTLKSEETGVMFKIEPISISYHCIESIAFFGPLE